MAEEKSEVSKKENSASSKFKQNPWMIATAVLGVALIIVLGFTLFGSSITGNVVSEKVAGDNLVKYIAERGGQAEIVSIAKEGALYNAVVSVQGSDMPIYLSLDGKYAIIQDSMIPLTANVVSDSASAQTATEVPKSDKPKVELFVMSFCPYGLEGEKLLKPVYDLLKDKVDFKIRYFATPNGAKIEDVQSLHGNLEAQEDARQVCIDKYYPDKLWDYVMEIATNCPDGYTSATKLDACWKAAAKKVGISQSKIEGCYAGEVSSILSRFTADGSLVTSYKLGGSESVVINGVYVPAGEYRWDSNKVKELVCNSFNSAPSECSQVLNSASSASASSANCNPA